MKRYSFQYVLLAFATLLCVTQSVFADDVIAPADPKLDRPVEFYQDVYPILQAKCLACHSSATAENDLVLESAESILKGGASGEGVIPGKPDESYVYLVSTRGDEPAMPPLPNKAQAKSLTPKELGILKQWIVEGAKGGTKPTDSDLAWHPVPESYKAVYSLEVSPQERFVYAGRGNRIFVYDLVANREVMRLTDPSLIALQQDGKSIYGSGVAHRDFVHSMALSPDGNLLASGGYRVVKLWEKSAPEKLLETNLGGKVIESAIDPKGTWAAFVMEDRSVKLWNLINGSAGPAINVGESKVQAIAFAPDSETLVTGDETGVVKVWHMGDGKLISELKTPSPISAIATRTNGPQLITAHVDHVLRSWAWPAATASAEVKAIREFKGHSQSITTLTVLANDTEMLTASRDATVRIWNLDNGSSVFNQNQGGAVLDAVVSADNEWIAATGENKVVTLWNRKGQKITTVQGDQQLAAAVIQRTDDQAVAKSQLALATTALTEMEKDVKQREESLKKSKEQVETNKKALVEADKKAAEAKVKAVEAAKPLAEKPDDAKLKKAKETADKELEKQSDVAKKAKDAVTSAERAVTLSESSIKTAKKALERRKQEKTAAEANQKAADAALAEAKIASDKSNIVMPLLANGSSAGTVYSVGSGQAVQVWNIKTGAPLSALETPQADLQGLQTTANGALMTVSATGVASLWDTTPKWSLVGTLGSENGDVSKSPFTDRITALAFSPDGLTLAIGGGEPSRSGEISLWNVAERKLVRTLEEPHSDTVFDIDFSRDGARLVSGGADKFVKVFNVADGKFIRGYEGHTDHVLGVAFKADGSSLASAGSDKAIKIWNTETGEQRRTISNYSKQVTSVSFVGVSDNLISCSGDKNVKFHTASNGRNYRSFSGSEDFVYSAYATRDESLVISAGEDGVIRVWDGKKGNSIATFAPPAAATETAQK